MIDLRPAAQSHRIHFSVIFLTKCSFWYLRIIQKELTHTINLHPQYFGPQIKTFLTSRLYEEVEGTCSGRYGYIIAVVEIVQVGKGVLLSSTGYAEYNIKYKAIVFKPFRNEVVDGIVTTVNKVIYIETDWLLGRCWTPSGFCIRAGLRL